MMVIPERFSNEINTHLLGNMLLPKYPLILTIVGEPGVGKTWQLRSYIEALGFEIFSINAADLESERAGAPAKLLKEQYVNASINISMKKPTVIIIDDIDTTIGEWEQNTGTVNHQGILAFLMHIADNPYYIENIGTTKRVPIFCTGNNFDRLYTPFKRTGRMRKFDWIPNRQEKIDIIKSIFSFSDSSMSERLIDAYPTEPISFFSDLYTTQTISLLSDIACKAAYKQILSNQSYCNQLYIKYLNCCKSIDWMKILNELEKPNN